MADYTTPEAVQALSKRLPAFSATSPVTLTQVNRLIDQHEAEINVALVARGFSVPLTEPSWLVTWAQKLATEGVAAAVLKAAFQDAQGVNSESSWAEWARRYRDGLAWIRDSKNELTAVEITNNLAGVASWSNYAGTTSTLDEAAEPLLSMGMDW